MAPVRGEWGGRREGAGRKPGWRSGKCKAVKLPVALLDEVLRYAHQLDAGEVSGAPKRKLVSPPERPMARADNDERWAQVSKLVDEKAELRRHLEHQGKLLAGELKKRLREEQRARELQARIDDARSILRAAYDEHQHGVRKGIRLADVRSALLALGVDVDAP